MRHRLPSLNALRAVEAIARHGSISGAAKELRVSPGAVSRQRALLEAYFKCDLFIRNQKGLRLSERGSKYLRRVGEAFDLIDEASDELADKVDRSRLSVRAFGAFGTEWLLPHLAEFEALHPDIDVSLTTQPRTVNFRTEDADVGIVVGTRGRTTLNYERLYTPNLLPVLSGKLEKRLGKMTNPNDLKRYPLLHSMGSPFGWKEWLDAVGATQVDARRGHRLSNYSQVYSATRRGVGVALGQLLLVGDELIAGNLVAPFNKMMTWGSDPYYIAWPKRRAAKREIEIFCSWLQQAVEKQEARLKTAMPKLRVVKTG